MTQSTIFITGAAAGIGRATARLFAARGWFVGAYDVDQGGLEQLQAEIGTQRVLIRKLDVTSTPDWNSALAELFERTGRLDVLLNNAGILASGPFEQTPVERHERVVDVNVKGVLKGCHAAFPYLKRTRGARVINLASASAIYGQPSLALYSATKFAVRGLTEALELEWGAQGIRVMDVLPLFVKTEMVAGMDAKSIDTLGVHLTAEDVAETIHRAATSTRALPRVHWPVGLQTQLFYLFTRLSPEWLTRFMTGKIAV